MARNTPEYQAWADAKSRCTNPNHKRYSDWGGRGIEFRFESFADFYMELGPRPEGYTLDRINNEGHYETGNVRWATRTQQQHNRRRNETTGVRQVKTKGLVTTTYQAYIHIEGKFHQLYTGPSYEDAVAARRKAEEELV
jgi:hypothetical protein